MKGKQRILTPSWLLILPLRVSRGLWLPCFGLLIKNRIVHEYFSIFPDHDIHPIMIFFTNHDYFKVNDIFTDMTLCAWPCDQSAEDAYSSTALGPSSFCIRGPCLLWFCLVFFLWTLDFDHWSLSLHVIFIKDNFFNKWYEILLT